MNDTLVNFIRAKHIDSFQKLRFLLFLYQHPNSSGTSREFAERLYMGDIPLLEKIITDLHEAGLVDCVEDCFKLHDELHVKLCLQCLAEAFEDPLNRQEILAQVKSKLKKKYGEEQNETRMD